MHEFKMDNIKVLLPGIPGITNRGFLGYCSVTLFQLQGKWALFDTGHQADRQILLDALAQQGLNPEDIRHVIISHLHFDHILNLPLFRQAEIYISQAELDYAENVSRGSKQDPAIFDLWPELIKDRKIHSFQGELQLDEAFRLLHLPGHTPGCLALFYSGPETVAICGDVIKNAWEAQTRRSTMIKGDANDAKNSIEKILQIASIIVPGHDRAFRRINGKLEFLSALDWRIKASLYPQEQERTVLSINLRQGLVGEGCSC